MIILKKWDRKYFKDHKKPKNEEFFVFPIKIIKNFITRNILPMKFQK